MKLSYLVYSGVEQLSLPLQGKDTTIKKATQATELAVHYLQRQRTDEAFSTFYSSVVDQAKELTDPPKYHYIEIHQIVLMMFQLPIGLILLWSTLRSSILKC